MIRLRKVGKKGFKVDVDITAAMHYENDRSFQSVDGHEILFGKDKEEQRKIIYDRCKGRCELHLSPRCKGFTNWDSHFLEGWAHLDLGTPHRNHCDCLGNAAFGCDPCHSYFHQHSKVAREILRRRQEKTA